MLQPPHTPTTPNYVFPCSARQQGHYCLWVWYGVDAGEVLTCANGPLRLAVAGLCEPPRHTQVLQVLHAAGNDQMLFLARAGFTSQALKGKQGCARVCLSKVLACGQCSVTLQGGLEGVVGW